VGSSDLDMEVDFDICKGGSANGAYPRIIVYMHYTLLAVLHVKEGPQPRIIEVVSCFTRI